MQHTPPWLISLVEEHFEELQLLWELRLNATRDHVYYSTDVKELDERILAHADGLIVGSQAAASVIQEAFCAADRCLAFAAAFAALMIDSQELLNQLMSAVDAAETAESLDGFADAFCMCHRESACLELRKKLESSSANVASVAAFSLAFHGLLDKNYSRLSEFLVDDDESVRRRGWDIVSLIGK